MKIKKPKEQGYKRQQVREREKEKKREKERESEKSYISKLKSN